MLLLEIMIMSKRIASLRGLGIHHLFGGFERVQRLVGFAPC